MSRSASGSSAFTGVAIIASSRAARAAPGSDERKKKATYPSLHGLAASKQRARALIEETKRLLDPLGPAAAPICALADFVFERRS